MNKTTIDEFIRTQPKLQRRYVWCLQCGAKEKLDATTYLMFGWPKCCNRTMSLDTPEERKAFERRLL